MNDQPNPEPERQHSGINPQPISDTPSAQMDQTDRLQLAFAAMAKDALGLVLQDLHESYPGQRPTIAVQPIIASMNDALSDIRSAFSAQHVPQAAKPLALLAYQALVLSALTDVECMRAGATPTSRYMAKNLIPREKGGDSGPWMAECRGEGCDWSGETYDADCPQCGRETVEYLDDNHE